MSFHAYEEIAGKRVWVVESHHQALHAWSIMRRPLPSPPTLITLDHHTDLRAAFLVHCFKKFGDKEAESKFRRFAVDESRKIDFNDDRTVLDAIKRLRYDEHIHAAHLAGIIGKTYVSLGWSSAGCSAPGSWATIFHDDCLPPCDRNPHDDTCSRRVADHVIGDELILPRIARIETDLGKAIEDTSFILDIDLDVFATAAAVAPSSCAGFHRLIRASIGVSIAMERKCVENGALPGVPINSDLLLCAVKGHIAHAMS